MVAAQFGEAALASLTSEADLHDAAKDAVKKARRAAMQEREPWPGAKGEDLEDVAMALAETFRAFGGCTLTHDTKAILREATEALTSCDLLEPGYRDMMRGTFGAMFPAENAGTGAGGGFGGGQHAGVFGGGPQEAEEGESQQHSLFVYTRVWACSIRLRTTSNTISPTPIVLHASHLPSILIPSLS